MAMKITLSAAMRARDVSRPQPDDLAQAEEADATAARAPRTPAGAIRGSGRDRSPSGPAAAAPPHGPSPAVSSAGASSGGASAAGSSHTAGRMTAASPAEDRLPESRPAGRAPGTGGGGTGGQGRRRRRRR